jgi:hypothetical protein
MTFTRFSHRSSGSIFYAIIKTFLRSMLYSNCRKMSRRKMNLRRVT